MSDKIIHAVPDDSPSRDDTACKTKEKVTWENSSRIIGEITCPDCLKVIPPGRCRQDHEWAVHDHHGDPSQDQNPTCGQKWAVFCAEDVGNVTCAGCQDYMISSINHVLDAMKNSPKWKVTKDTPREFTFSDPETDTGD